MNETQAKIIVAYARNGMRVTKTAAALYYDRRVIYLNFKKIRENTGLNPRNFFDLVELYTIAVGILGDDY